MSAQITVFGRQQLISALFTPDIVVLPSHLYVCYTHAVAPDNADGSQLDEPAALDGYARVAIAMTSAAWTPTGFAEVFNAAADAFPAPTGDWGLLQGQALADDAAIGAGNVYVVGGMIEPFVVRAGDDPPPLNIGDLLIGLRG